MQSALASFWLVFLALHATTALPGKIDDAVGLGEDIKDLISDIIPHEIYDGSYLNGILELLSGWRVSRDDIGLGKFRFGSGNLGVDLDSGKLFGGDFLGSIADKFTDNFESTLDRVTGLFDGEQASLADYFRSKEKLHDHFGFTKECTGPGFICGEKIPDACTGPTYSFVIDGGVCILDEDSGEVICSRPSVSIAKVPATCNLKYDEGTTTLGYSCVDKIEFGEKIEKSIGKEPRTLNVGDGEPFQFLGLDDLPFDLDVFFDKVSDKLSREDPLSDRK